ncbi:MAG: FAD-dependent oxidoreductase, partial [Candidatus Zixiibacteriota bacterium]
ANQNVRVISGSGVRAVDLGSDDVPVVTIDGDNRISCDFVFLALGLHPEAGLAKTCGLEIGPTGGIVVNRNMQTSDPDIYAGGDCAQTFQRLTGHPVCIAMGSLANRQGRVIAENLAGCDGEWPGVLGTTLVKVFDVSVGSTGLTSSEAARAGIGARAVWGSFPDRPDYFPEMEMIVLKMVYAESDGRLLGLQAVGRGPVGRWVDLYSSFLQRDAKAGELLDLEHGYAPPYSEALDPLHQLAGMALAQMNGISFTSPLSLETVAREGSKLLLDVRETEESVEKPVSSFFSDVGAEVVNIPLEDLRSRLSELDRTRPLLVVCQRGSRSYQAAVVLRAAGFEKVDILSAGLQSQAW